MSGTAPLPGQRAILRFAGAYAFLSNFYRRPVTWGGVTWPTAEHAFQAAKSGDGDYRSQLLATPEPREAKRLGRAAMLPHGWEGELRIVAMDSVLRAKFADPFMAALLWGTGEALLVEGNTWHDNFWGDCRCGRPECAAPGQNALGQRLMLTRLFP